jgi:hypothetical protein
MSQYFRASMSIICAPIRMSCPKISKYCLLEYFSEMTAIGRVAKRDCKRAGRVGRKIDTQMTNAVQEL